MIPAEIDRLAPGRRPAARAVMLQTWSHLLFLHWPVDPQALRRLVPPELDIDTFEGRAYVGLVPFTITGLRPTWMPAPRALSAFHETNVRTYVRRGSADPGVWFFSLDAANLPAVVGARTLYRLPYYWADIRMAIEADFERSGLSIDYALRRFSPRGASCRVTYRPSGAPRPALVGTLEHFLVERYILYAQSWRRLYRAQVHHVPYPLQGANATLGEETLLRAAGIVRPSSEPLAHYASSVRVEVFGLQRVEPA